MKWGCASGAVDRDEELKDGLPFPFGKYGPKGAEPCTMGEVPASYLDWISRQEWIHEWPAVEKYIERNWKAIDQDL